jgi:hypothetical protein
MRRGDFAAAWRVSDRILAGRPPGERCWHLPRHEQWVWDGRPLADRTVLVRCYHGLGDTIQFARFLPLLASLGCQTLVWAQPPLLPLLATLPGVRRLLPLHDGDPGVDYDVDLEIMELAHALRVGAHSLPGCVPYFDVPRGPRVSDRLSVGVLAQAGGWDPRRSVPADMLTRLSGAESVALFNLQLEPPLPGMADLSTPDLLLLASRLRSLDLVITPDTMLAHLAGALGVATWTLLPADADWRWMGSERTDSPWYPTMRLFRQPRPGDWEAVIAEVRRQLAHLVPHHRSRRHPRHGRG